MHVRAGFRAIARQPALVLAEIAWRWAFGAAAWALVVVAFRRVLVTVDVTPVELLIARHSDLFLVADACARILYQVLPRLARECLVLLPAITVLWIAAATVGRAITLKGLVGDRPRPATSSSFGQLALLNFLRALFTLATFAGLMGAMLLTGMVVPVNNLAAIAAAALFLAGVIAVFWSMVNWFLALAPIWIVRDGSPVLKAFAESVNFSRRQSGRYSSISVWFGLLRGAAFMVAFVAAILFSQASPAVSLAASIVVALVYFAAADLLYIARLAAFVSLEESPEPSAVSYQAIAES